MREDGGGDGLWRLFAGTALSGIKSVFSLITYGFEKATVLMSPLSLSRRISMRCTHLLTGSALHILVHSGSHLPVLLQKTQTQRCRKTIFCSITIINMYILYAYSDHLMFWFLFDLIYFCCFIHSQLPSGQVSRKQVQ